MYIVCTTHLRTHCLLCFGNSIIQDVQILLCEFVDKHFLVTVKISLRRLLSCKFRFLNGSNHTFPVQCIVIDDWEWYFQGLKIISCFVWQPICQRLPSNGGIVTCNHCVLPCIFKCTLKTWILSDDQ